MSHVYGSTVSFYVFIIITNAGPILKYFRPAVTIGVTDILLHNNSEPVILMSIPAYAPIILTWIIEHMSGAGAGWSATPRSTSLVHGYLMRLFIITLHLTLVLNAASRGCIRNYAGCAAEGIYAFWQCQIKFVSKHPCLLLWTLNRQPGLIWGLLLMSFCFSDSLWFCVVVGAHAFVRVCMRERARACVRACECVRASASSVFNLYLTFMD